MALRKYVPRGNTTPVNIKSLSFTKRENGKANEAYLQKRPTEADVDVDLSEVYFLIMHFLSTGPCHRTYGQFWNELLEHQLLPRRYHAWGSRGGMHSGDENDDGISFPLSYNKLVERHPHVEKDHLVKLLKQLILGSVAPSGGLSGGNTLNAATVPTLLGTGSFSLLDSMFPVPLSIEVIQSRLEYNYYRTLEAVKHDVEVLLSNAESYFGKDAELSTKINRLSDWFRKTLSSL